MFGCLFIPYHEIQVKLVSEAPGFVVLTDADHQQFVSLSQKKLLFEVY